MSTHCPLNSRFPRTLRTTDLPVLTAPDVPHSPSCAQAGSHRVHQHVKEARTFVLRETEPLSQCVLGLRLVLASAVDGRCEKVPATDIAADLQAEGKSSSEVSGTSVTEGEAQADDWWESDEEDGTVSDQLQPWARRKQDRVQTTARKEGKQAEADQPPQQPRSLEVACVGGPFFRFLRTETAKNTIAAAPGGGGGWYHVKQPEWKLLKLSGGCEFTTCMAAWPSQRLLAEITLAALFPPPLATRQTMAQAAVSLRPTAAALAATQAAPSKAVPPRPHAHLAASLPWGLRMTPEAASHFGAAALPDASLAEALRPLCAWLPGALLLRPLPVLLAESAVQDLEAQQINGGTAAADALADSLASPGWCSGASVSVRWWSAGSMEPLRAEPMDRLLVQVSGACHVVVVDAEHALDCLSPFPSDHPYDGYSAPAVAATACRPHPSNAHAAQQQARHLPQQGQAQELDKDGQSSTSEQISQASVQLTEQQRQQHDLQLVRAEEEAAGVEAAVLELWPGFANAHGREAVLQPGDALYVPAGAFVHTESLECGAVDSSASASATEEAQLPGNVMMVVDLWAASPALAPRSRGALEMQAARVAERWAKHCSGSVCRVREMLLATADRFDGAAAAAAPSYQPDRQRSQISPVSSANPTAPSWVCFPCSAAHDDASTRPHTTSSGASSPTDDSPSISASHSLAAAAFSAWPPAHWVHLSSWDREQSSSECKENSSSTDSSGDKANGTAEVSIKDSSAKGSKGSALGSSTDSRVVWPPSWNGWQSLPGWKQVELGKQLLSLCSPLVAAAQLEQAQQQGRSGSSQDTASPSLSTCAGTAQLLRRFCEGRLLPTTWLNKLAHNDPLLLSDVPYRYAIEYRSNDEARFPELFKPQLERREAKARKQAAAAHWAQQKRLLQEEQERRALEGTRDNELFLLL